MIIRKLNSDEGMQATKVQSLSFAFSSEVTLNEKKVEVHNTYGSFLDDDKTLVSMIRVYPAQSKFSGQYVLSNNLGDVSTLPEYRRSGCVRKLIHSLLEDSYKQGVLFSYLYPFSSSYYRQFGYEAVTRVKDIAVDISKFEEIPKNSNVVLYRGEDEYKKMLSEVFLKYSEGKNILFKPEGNLFYNRFSDKPNSSKNYTYIWLNKDNEAGAYVIYSLTPGESVYTRELIYTTPESLYSVLGFLRLYEGQVKNITFMGVPSDTPLEYMLRHYKHISTVCAMRAMGRVIDVEKLLKIHDYKNKTGGFSVKIEDIFEWNNFIFDVSYKDGKPTVNKRKDGSYDIALSIQAFTQIALGFDVFNPEKVSFMHGVKLFNKDSEIFDVFPYTPCVLYAGF